MFFASRFPGGRLFRKHVTLIGGAMAMLLAVGSAINMWWSFREQEALLGRLQRVHADAAAARIADFVGGIEAQLSWMTHRSWTNSSPQERQLEALRLLRQVPPIAELTLIDDKGREQVKVSRLAMDVVSSGIDRSQDGAYMAALARKVHYGPVRFRSGSEPVFAVSLAGERRAAGVVIAEVDLKYVWDVVNEVKVDSGAVAYVVDADGRLIAHPDMSLVLRVSEVGKMPNAHSARMGDKTAVSSLGTGMTGDKVLFARSVITPLGWHVFVEFRVTEAYAPVFASLWRSIALLVLSLGAALAIALHLAKVFSEPIKALHTGAISLGHGNLGHRLMIRTGDELEELGGQFNAMASRLQASYADLERRVAERTRELEQANLAKTRFIAVASHDLRQPLHALGMFIGQLSAPRDVASLRRIVERAEASVAAMNELFDSLLDISRIDAQQLSPNVHSSPVQRLLDYLHTTYSNEAARKGLSLRLPRNGAWIASDPLLLERIVGNLVSNAIRYTLRGGVVVLCRRRGDTLRIEVWDSGPGIPGDQLQSIFSEFVRLEPDSGSKTQGLGLGLAIVERLARLLGHGVEARSIVGRGSRFCIHVPIACEAADGKPASEQVTPPDQVGNGRLVALIDDDPAVRDGTKGLLRSWGFAVVAAASTEDLIELIATDQLFPAVIVADYELSGGRTGLEGIARVRNACGRDIAAFLVSGIARDDRRLQEARSAGFEVLLKPLAPQVLRTALLRHLRPLVAN